MKRFEQKAWITVAADTEEGAKQEIDSLIALAEESGYLINLEDDAPEEVSDYE